MQSTSLAVLASLLLASTVHAQEGGHRGGHPSADSAATATGHEGMAMSSGPLGIGMQREGSGTSWLPDASPMHAIHSMAGRWELMLHGSVFLQYVEEGSDRGDGQLGAVNWIMGMASRPLGAGRLGFRAMLSAEPLTVGACGYPDLLATGEFCRGEPLHDRQHPHDLFMELAAHWRHPLGKNVALELYGGPVGEPALGPVAYPHRVSALPGPLAPIGHHWQDATHISFGVATAGLYGRRWKVEGSVFNGREPDEHRFDFDFAPLDSYSGRVTLLPDDRWALQASLGRLIEAEAPREPGEGRADVTRATASATYHQSVGPRGTWATTLAWGRNRAHGLTTDAWLVESNLTLDERNTVFGRAELARKSGEDLALEDEAPALAEELFNVGKVSVGYLRRLGRGGPLLPRLGAQVSLNLIPSELEAFYGSSAPFGVAVFASLMPRPMPGEHAAAAGGMPGMQTQPAPHGQHGEQGQAPAGAAAAPGRAGHAPLAPCGHAGEAGHRGMDGGMAGEPVRLMQEIHARMMADPVICERAATDAVLQRLMQRVPQGSGGEAGHRAGEAPAGARQPPAATPGHGGHAPMGAAGRDTAAHAGHPRTEGGVAGEPMRLMEEIHARMMADPVIRERVATDPVLQRLMQGLPEEMRGDTTAAHAGHRMDGAMDGTAADDPEARQAMEFVTLLLSDPRIEARVHADPRLHRLWSDPEVQRCLETMRRLKAVGQPLPAACPAPQPAAGRHPSH